MLMNLRMKKILKKIKYVKDFVEPKRFTIFVI